jgi:hypothetical protein
MKKYFPNDMNDDDEAKAKGILSWPIRPVDTLYNAKPQKQGATERTST